MKLLHRSPMCVLVLTLILLLVGTTRASLSLGLGKDPAPVVYKVPLPTPLDDHRARAESALKDTYLHMRFSVREKLAALDALGAYPPTVCTEAMGADLAAPGAGVRALREMMACELTLHQLREDFLALMNRQHPEHRVMRLTREEGPEVVGDASVARAPRIGGDAAVIHSPVAPEPAQHGRTAFADVRHITSLYHRPVDMGVKANDDDEDHDGIERVPHIPPWMEMAHTEDGGECRHAIKPHDLEEAVDPRWQLDLADDDTNNAGLTVEDDEITEEAAETYLAPIDAVWVGHANPPLVVVCPGKPDTDEAKSYTVELVIKQTNTLVPLCAIVGLVIAAALSGFLFLFMAVETVLFLRSWLHDPQDIEEDAESECKLLVEGGDV